MTDAERIAELEAEVERLQSVIARMGGTPPNISAMAVAEYSASKMEEALRRERAASGIGAAQRMQNGHDESALATERAAREEAEAKRNEAWAEADAARDYLMQVDCSYDGTHASIVRDEVLRLLGFDDLGYREGDGR